METLFIYINNNFYFQASEDSSEILSVLSSSLFSSNSSSEFSSPTQLNVLNYFFGKGLIYVTNDMFENFVATEDCLAFSPL